MFTSIFKTMEKIEPVHLGGGKEKTFVIYVTGAESTRLLIRLWLRQ